MAIAFPEICPTEREYTCPDYPLTDGSWRGVANFPKPWSDTPVDARLRLRFTNIPDSSAAAIITAWNQSVSGVFPLDLPAVIADGIEDADLANRIIDPNGLVWKFSGPPSVVNVIPGISTVTVELIADVGARNNSPRSSNVFIEVGPGNYSIYEIRGGQGITTCVPRFTWGTQASGPASTWFSYGTGTTVSSVNNVSGEYVEFEVYVPLTPARSCAVPWELPPLEQYTTTIYGVKSNGDRDLIYSKAPSMAGWYRGLVAYDHGNTIAGPSSVGIKNNTTGEKFGPFYNRGFTPGWSPGTPLGTTGYLSTPDQPNGDIITQVSEIPVDWFNQY